MVMPAAKAPNASAPHDSVAPTTLIMNITDQSPTDPADSIPQKAMSPSGAIIRVGSTKVFSLPVLSGLLLIKYRDAHIRNTRLTIATVMKCTGRGVCVFEKSAPTPAPLAIPTLHSP